MSDSTSGRARASLADSPWFWAIVFSTAGFVALALIWPQYVKRQRRLEMQFQAQQEIARRRVAGEPKARLAGQEGDAPPPDIGELIIPIWPLSLGAAAVAAFSAIMLCRSRRVDSTLHGGGEP